MAKTLVVAKHSPGPHANGYDGCHGRWAEDGMCPGVKAAKWLNELGDDDEQFTQRFTNGQVRDNWLKSYGHLVAVDPALANWKAEERRLQASLRLVKKEIRRLETAAKQTPR